LPGGRRAPPFVRPLDSLVASAYPVDVTDGPLTEVAEALARGEFKQALGVLNTISWGQAESVEEASAAIRLCDQLASRADGRVARKAADTRRRLGYRYDAAERAADVAERQKRANQDYLAEVARIRSEVWGDGIVIPCAKCKVDHRESDPDSLATTCTACGATCGYALCGQCTVGVRTGDPRPARYDCWACGGRDLEFQGAPNRSALEYIASFYRLGFDGLPAELRTASFASGFVFVGGYGLEIPAGSHCGLFWTDDRATVWPTRRGFHPARIPLSQIQNVEIGGPGAVTTGGSLMGGGLGPIGAAEGMLAASLINSLTTKTKIHTMLSIRSTEFEGFFFTDRFTPDRLRIAMSGVIGRVSSQAQTASSTPVADSAADPVVRLRELAQLRDDGLMTPEEFEAARKRLVRELT
jgi:hypothetical protein